MVSPVNSALITAAYFAFVIIGPKYMQNRKPLELKLALQIYNFTMVCLASFIAIKVSITIKDLAERIWYIRR